MADAARLAASDTGTVDTASLLASLDVVVTLPPLFPPTPLSDNPSKSVADRIGAINCRYFSTDSGGQCPQRLVNEFSQRIAAGEADMNLASPTSLPWKESAGGHCHQLFTHGELWTKEEAYVIFVAWYLDCENVDCAEIQLKMWTVLHESRRHGLVPHVPAYYALMESAYRWRAGRTPEQHKSYLGALMSPFTEIAAKTEGAWQPSVLTADQLVMKSQQNRMVALPYTKFMCSNNGVDMAAAVLLMSEAHAAVHGVPSTRLLYLHGCGDCDNPTPVVSQRPDLTDHSAMRIAGQKALSSASLSVSDISLFDIYSCFPLAVEAAVQELQIPPKRELTVTGGLAYYGGPGNHYSLHSIALMRDRLLSTSDLKAGMVLALGGFMTLFSCGVYSAMRPGASFQRQPPEEYAIKDSAVEVTVVSPSATVCTVNGTV
eukprot:gene10184-1838_t